MRRHIALIALLALGACGGGDDITSPPGTFTLTVSGEGTGGGRVTTATGVSPALDCAVAPNTQPAGACSASYAAGTVVDLTVAPDASSTFTGWGGDASSCSTGLTCSITMDQNRSAVAQLTAGATVEIVSSAFYPDPEFAGEGAVIWVVEARNTGSQVVESAKIDFTSHDASGAVLASDFTFVGPIPPGETRAGQSFADFLGTEASVDMKVSEVILATEDPNLGAAQIVSSNWRVDPEFNGTGAVVWTAEVQNTSSVELEGVQVDFTTYDASGKILGYDATFAGPIPPGEIRSLESFTDIHGNEANAKFQIGSVF
jgi:List-Bact-rpt repeat protein